MRKKLLVIAAFAPMTRNTDIHPSYPAIRRRMAFGMLVFLGACGAGVDDQGGLTDPAGGGGTGGTGSLVTASVRAVTEICASVVSNNNTLPVGSVLDNATISASNTELNLASEAVGTATGMFGLHNDGGPIVYTITESAVSNGNQGQGTLGTHETLLRLEVEQPMDGTLTIELSGERSSPAGTAWTMIDIGNNQISEHQTGALNHTFQQQLTIQGAFELRTTTLTNAAATSSITRSVTISFEPHGTTGGGGGSGPGGGPGLPPGNGDPLATTLDFSVVNRSANERTETIRASVPFPRGTFSQAELDELIVSGHKTAWLPLQYWPDGSIKVAQAQFTDVLEGGEAKAYELARNANASTEPFTRNQWVGQFSGSFDIGAEIRDTYNVPYRSYVSGAGEVLQSTALCETRRFRTYHEAVNGGGIGRDYLTSTYYVTEFSDLPFVIIDWVVGNDYLGADDPAGSTDPNLYALGDADVRAAYFLCRGASECIPYRAIQEQVEAAIPMSDGYEGFRVMQDTYLSDAQTRRYRFLARFEPVGASASARDRWRDSANASAETPIFSLATQAAWEQTGAAGLVGGPIAGPSDAYNRAALEHTSWSESNVFGTWGYRGDAPSTAQTGTPRNHPLSPEFAHAVQGQYHLLLEKLEQKAWAQAMRPYHLYDLEVGAEQQILLWSGTPLLSVPGETLGRRAIQETDPYPGYRTMSQGQPTAHGWGAYDHEHWSTDLLFDYWTVSGDAWAKEELRQLGQSLKGLMRLDYYYTQLIQPVRAEGWCMQGFAQVFQATQDPSIKAYAMRRVDEIIDLERMRDHPSRAMTFQENYPSTGYPNNHEFFMPWQHGAVLYGFLGAYRAFEEPKLLEIAEDVATTVEYSWVTNINHPNHGWVPNGLRYYVPVSHNGVPVTANYWDYLPQGANLGSSPLGGVHTFLVSGLHLLADATQDPVVQAKALNYGNMLNSTFAEGSRWNKWFYCMPAAYVGQ